MLGSVPVREFPIWCLDFVIYGKTKSGSNIMLSSWTVPREHCSPCSPTAGLFSGLGAPVCNGTMSPNIGYQTATTELVSSAVNPEQRGKQQRIPRAGI